MQIGDSREVTPLRITKVHYQKMVDTRGAVP
jgi:hypothetical protein